MKNNVNIKYMIYMILTILGILALTRLYVYYTVDDIDEVKPVGKIENVEVQDVDIKTEEVIVKDNKALNLEKLDIDDSNKTEPVKKSENQKDLEEDGIPADFIAENNLPPYPGKDGGPGILGTDVNDNEIRDDIEREIFWKYREFPEEVRNVFLTDVVSVKRSLDVGIAIKNGNFDEEALIEREKSFEESIVCDIYYTKYQKFLDKKIDKYQASKRTLNTEERQEIEENIHLYGLGIPKYGEIDDEEEVARIFKKANEEARKYSSYVRTQMKINNRYDDEKAREFCTEITSKYLN